MNSMDIFTRPPAIAEDTLQYTLYPVGTNGGDKPATAALVAQIEAHARALLPDHIWHRDAFELQVVQPGGTGGSWALEGRMRVGDCIDDEWCAVWLLREASTRWNVAVSVFDSDGEFLLIEAADVLPAWVTPENAENRVWIYRSHLHLIPLSYVSSPSRRHQRRRPPGAHDSDGEGELAGDQEDGFITVQDALKILADPTIDTSAPQAVEDVLWQRVSQYPAVARQHVHVARAVLPVDIAKALDQEPALVQKAAEAFYTRDAVQLRAAHRMSRFPPQPEVLCSVKMTRTAYAQLMGQKFHPPKIFSRFAEREGSREWKWRDIGMKIACGFEMLYQEGKARSEGTSSATEAGQASADARKEALKRNPDYTKYIQTLVSTGYFQGEIEGSRKWNELEDKATAVFINMRQDDDATRPSFACLVNDAITRAAGAPIPQPPQDEDSDDWLNVSAEDLDAKLAQAPRPAQTAGSGASYAMETDELKDVDESDRLTRTQTDRLHGLAEKIESFVEGEGTMEGAVFEDDDLSDDGQMSEFSEEEFSSGSDADDDSGARQEAMDKLVAGIDPSEYGKMPASFYNNSQKVAPTTLETEMSVDVGVKALSDAVGTEPPRKPPRKPILARDKFDGVDSDDETDEDDIGVEDDESEEDRPQVVGDIEIDMAEEEEEFLSFTRDALGISQELWDEIVRDRKRRGAFVPSSVLSDEERVPPKHLPNSSSLEGNVDIQPHSLKQGSRARPSANPNLDSFEAVMQAMDEELARVQTTRRAPEKVGLLTTEPGARKGKSMSGDKEKGKGRASPTAAEDDDDVEDLMDAELRAALERDEGDSGDEEPMDYNLIKNFLESFKSQAGLSGPVSNLAGRLEPRWNLPRDAS